MLCEGQFLLQEYGIKEHLSATAMALPLHGRFSGHRCSVEAACNACCLCIKQQISRYTIPLNNYGAQFLRNGESRNFMTGTIH
jgi:hypothetical protein